MLRQITASVRALPKFGLRRTKAQILSPVFLPVTPSGR